MLTAYFDTNVYDRIDKGHVPVPEVLALRDALSQGRLIAHLSVSDIEELLGDWETKRQLAVKRLRVAGELVGFAHVLKAPPDLLEESIRAYAAGIPEPSPILPRKERRFIAAALGRIVGGSRSLAPHLSEMVAHVRRLKRTFLHSMRERGTELAKRIVASEAAGTFEEFWATDAVHFAAAFADRHDLTRACETRGLHGLLDMRAVKLAAGGGMSLVFALAAEGRQAQASDVYDLWHAIMASAADVFVTYDERLLKLLARVPIERLRVVGSVAALLDDL
jgi:hypothetical protein